MFTNKKQFKIDCKVLDIHFEYENFKGKEKYIIASKLSEDEIRMIYPEEAKRYSPFIKVGLEFCEIRNQFKSNDKKHNQRLTKNIGMCRYDDIPLVNKSTMLSKKPLAFHFIKKKT